MGLISRVSSRTYRKMRRAINGAIRRCLSTHDTVRKAQVVERLLAAKATSQLTFDDISTRLGLTNAYTAQLFLGQAQLKDGTKDKLANLFPTIPDADLQFLQGAPMRGYDPTI